MFDIPDSVLRPPATDQLFEGHIRHPDVYIWDAWAVRQGQDILLYTLASPRDVYKSGLVDIQTQRDHIPHHHRLFISSDEGATWRDKGAAFWPRTGEDCFDSRSVWTGGVLPYEGGLIGGYTGIRQTDDAHPFIQSIGLFYSKDDGLSFTRISDDDALSCPIRDYDEIKSKGYYLGPKDDLGSSAGEEGNCILAWRDPSFCLDEKGQLHAFWGAKTGTGDKQRPAVAHAIIHDPMTSPRLDLLPPVTLPDEKEFTQAEVPQILYHPAHKLFYMVVSTTDRIDNAQLDADLDLSSRLYTSENIAGPWVYAGHLIRKADKRYPAVLVGFDEEGLGDKLLFTAPYNRSNGDDLMHTMPRLNKAVIEKGRVTSID